MCEPQPLYDNDTLGRWLYHSKVPQNVGKLDIFPPMVFPSIDGNKESINCLRFFRTPIQDSHHLGLRREESKPENKYLGYGITTMQRIKSINEGGVFFTVSHTPDSSNHAHCDIEMNFTTGSQGLRSSKNNAKVKLGDFFLENIQRYAG